jgi:ribosomal protein S18 acetylase RimI-like enzyme
MGPVAFARNSAEKIVERADRFEAWDQRNLVGLVAAYRDDPSSTMFISNVSIDQPYRRRGLAAELVRHCIDFAREQRLSRVTLEVDPANRSAIALYASHGFVAQDVEGPVMLMQLEIEPTRREGAT